MHDIPHGTCTHVIQGDLDIIIILCQQRFNSFILLSVGFWENSESESEASDLPMVVVTVLSKRLQMMNSILTSTTEYLKSLLETKRYYHTCFEHLFVGFVYF